MLPLPWPFDREFMQLALLCGVLVGASAPLIGTFLVQKRLSLLGDGIGHLAFAGVAVGLWFGTAPIWTAMVAAVAGAIAIELLRMRNRLPGDLVLALFFYSGIAGGVVVSSATGSLNASVLSYLFGSILTVTTTDAWTIAGLGLFIVVAITLTSRALFTIVIDEEAARVSGLPVVALNLGFAILSAVTIVAAMRVVGLLLVAALMVLPVATSQQVARSFRATMHGASLVGVLSVVVGLVVARLGSVAPGGAIVLTAAVFFLLAVVFGRRIVAPAH
jgi:zinc transport system permease protein